MRQAAVTAAALAFALTACSQAGYETSVAPVARTHADTVATTTRVNEDASVATMAQAASTGAQPADTSGIDGCPAGATPVFSCRIAASGKRAALCIGSGAGASASYRFGSRSKTEMRYPGENETASAVFHRTPLTFAGATGGYAYSFRNAGTTYALYSVSGNDGLARAGVAVLDADGRKIADLPCDLETLRETDSLDAIRATRAWSSDPLVDKVIR